MPGGLNYVESRIELIKTFDQDFNLDTGRYGVEMTKSESLGGGSLYEYWAEEYARNKIWDIWHISFDEYIDRPSFMIELLHSAGERASDKELNALEKLKQALNGK